MKTHCYITPRRVFIENDSGRVIALPRSDCDMAIRAINEGLDDLATLSDKLAQQAYAGLPIDISTRETHIMHNQNVEMVREYLKQSLA